MEDNRSRNDTLLSLNELLDAVNGKLIGAYPEKSLFSFTSVTTDSRNVTENTLFVPLYGEFQDGHIYIPQAVTKGATVVLIAEKSFCDKKDFYIDFAEKNKNVALIVVSDTLHALQKAAEKYVSKFPDLIRCSVTGSSGKTTTKELCVAVLSQKYNVVCNKGNFNSETGLPLSVFNIRSEHELGFFEMGMNRINEIGEIAEVFKPQYGVITNIGTAHIGILKTRDNIACEKKKIFNYLPEDGAAIIPVNDDYADYLSDNIKGRVIRYGIDNSSDGIQFIKDEGLDGTVFSVDGERIHLSLPGKYNYLDALAAVSLGKVLGLTPLQIKAGIESLKPLDGRSKIVKGQLNIMEDCYNANPDSMTAALEFCSDLPLSCRKIFVLGDMLELGSESEAEHKHVGKIVSESNADVVILFGEEMGYAYDVCCTESEKNASKRIIHIKAHDEEAVKEAASFINEVSEEGDFVLLKGSRGMGLERIIPLVNLE